MKQIFRAGTLFFIVGCLILIVSLSQSTYSLWKRTDVVHEQEEALKKLQEENIQLKNEVAQVQTSEFIEKEARDKLGLTKPGEQVILFDRESQSIEKKDAMESREQKPSLSVWFNMFF